MKRLLLIIGVLWLVLPLSRQAAAQTTEVLLRPTHIDISASTSKSAVLIKLSGYPSDEVRYRLYNGSKQYSCWDRETGTFISTNSYASGPLAIGAPSSSATFWIPFERGSNDGTPANYRDRLGPLYSVNYRDASLPAAISIETPFSITGTLLPGTGLPLTDKYIVLAFAQAGLVSATHSDIASGGFSVVCPVGATIVKIEIRTIGNEMVAVSDGEWVSSANLGTIQLSLVNRVSSERGSSAPGNSHAFRVYPVPAKQILNIEAGTPFSGVEITSLTGRRVMQSKFADSQMVTINIDGLTEGVYFVTVYFDNRRNTFTVIKN